MKEKSTAILILVFIALSISGFTYAQWNDVITISNTMTFGYWGDLNLGFVDPLTCSDNENTKNVGTLNCYYDNLIQDVDTLKWAYKELIIEIANAYPDYEVHCKYTLENIGRLPLHINETVISDPNNILTWDPAQGALVDANKKPIIKITTTPTLVCTTLQPEDDPNTQQLENKAEFEMAIHITDYAQECHTYAFQVQIKYEEAT
jgi:hypothetical protein